MDIDNKDEEDRLGKISRARNRTVMLTPEITGQVRNAIDKIAEDDFVKPGQIANTQITEESERKLIENKKEESVKHEAVKAMLEKQSTGLKFGKSTNRSRTTRIAREDLESVLRPDSPRPVESADGFNLPQPSIPKSFDPLTSLAPLGHSQQQQKPKSPKPRNPIAQRASSSRNIVAPNVATPSISTPDAETLNTQEQNLESVNIPATDMQAQVEQEMLPLANKARLESKPYLSAYKGKTKIIGFLISYNQDENGEVFHIRKGRKLITSRPTEHGEYMLIDHPSVSPLHAIIRTTKDNKIQIMDQLSEHGTTIIKLGSNEEIEVAGGLETVENGDTLRIGEISFFVFLLPNL